jgi:hypothetical protein
LSTLDAAFFESTQIKQDYTQFKPRAHYTDSSLLKTYFMAMKWLMREKFYFGSRPLANAAMILASTIPTEDLTELNKLSQQIFNLIGTDDDLTLEGMRSFVQRHFGLNQPTSISTAPDNIINELRTLQPQKIQSTAYQTDAPQSTTEEAAKQMTDGFIFFGEKFTLDSYIFDLMTAGSAEQEFTFKPNIQTALMIPDILEDSTVANQLVHLRLTEKQQLNQVLEMEGKTQLSSYEKMKQEASTKIDELLQTTTTPVMNVYHKWLQML